MPSQNGHRGQLRPIGNDRGNEHDDLIERLKAQAAPAADGRMVAYESGGLTSVVDFETAETTDLAGELNQFCDRWLSRLMSQLRNSSTLVSQTSENEADLLLSCAAQPSGSTSDIRPCRSCLSRQVPKTDRGMSVRIPAGVLDDA